VLASPAVAAPIACPRPSEAGQVTWNARLSTCVIRPNHASRGVSENPRGSDERRHSIGNVSVLG